MAITHVGTETASETGFGLTDTLTVTKPSGAAEDDVAVACICQDDDDPVGLPAGFTEINNSVLGGNDSTWAVGYKVLGASEPSSYDFPKDSGEDAVASISVFRGVDVEVTLDTTSSTNTGSGTFSFTATSITTNTDEAAVIAVAGCESGQASPFSPPSGMAEIVDLGVATNTGASLTVAWGEQATAGATGDKQFTSSDDETYGTTLLALRPASVAEEASGNVQSEDATATGSSTRIVKSSGTVVSQESTVTSQATRTVTSSGAVESDASTVAGQATRKVTSSGAVESQDATATGAAEYLTDVAASVVATANSSGAAFKESPAQSSVLAVAISEAVGNTIIDSFTASVISVASATLDGSTESPAGGSAIASADASASSDEIHVIASPSASVTARAVSKGSLGFSGSTFALADSEAVLTVTHNSPTVDVTATANVSADAVREVTPGSDVIAVSEVTSDAIRLYKQSSQQTAIAVSSSNIEATYNPTLNASAVAETSADCVKKSNAFSNISSTATSDADNNRIISFEASVQASVIQVSKAKAWKVVDSQVSAVANIEGAAIAFGKQLVSSSVSGVASHQALLSFVAHITPPPITATASVQGFLRGVLSGDAPAQRQYLVSAEHRSFKVLPNYWE